MKTKVDQRFVLALIWSIGALLMLAYIIWRFGEKTEILTLVIGIIGGSIVGGLFGYYFGATHKGSAAVPPGTVEATATVTASAETSTPEA